MAATKLHHADGRREAGKIILEGRHLVGEALESRVAVESIFTRERDELSEAAADRGAEVVMVSESVLKKLATTQHPAGPVAICPTPKLDAEVDGACVVAWGIGDPGNLGTMLRSCAAFGVPVLVGPDCADVWSPKVLRSAAGAHFRGRVRHEPHLTLDILRGWDLVCWAAVPAGGEREPAGRAAVLVGSEGAGLPEEIIEACERRVTIPMPGGMESLNAGVTGSIVAYHLAMAPDL